MIRTCLDLISVTTVDIVRIIRPLPGLLNVTALNSVLVIGTLSDLLNATNINSITVRDAVQSLSVYGVLYLRSTFNWLPNYQDSILAASMEKSFFFLFTLKYSARGGGQKDCIKYATP